MSDAPSVSVIVPAYNCEATIAQTLQAILGQKYSGVIEVVVVDDGSSDQTPPIVQSFAKVKYVRQDNAGPASARNRGVLASQHEIIFFTDSDCIPEQDWIEKMTTGFSKLGPDGAEPVAVAGSYAIVNGGHRLSDFIQEEIAFRHEKLMPQLIRSLGSYNFCIKRKIFAELGGFNTAYRFASGEDNDLSYRLIAAGYHIFFMKDAKVRHYHSTSLVKYLSEQFRHGSWRVKMYLDHPQMRKGDDYTFWKDILEVGWVLLICFCLLLSVFFSRFTFPIAAFLNAALLIFEWIFAWAIAPGIENALTGGLVMFLRAWARTLGFIYGLIVFLRP